jgi:hypothetical protein
MLFHALAWPLLKRGQEGDKKMKTITSILTVSMILLAEVSELWASQVLGYTVAEKQAKFYIIILSTMAVSIALVGAVYFVLWLAERKKVEPKAAVERELQAKWRLCFEDFSLSI